MRKGTAHSCGTGMYCRSCEVFAVWEQAVDPVLLGKVRAKQYYSDDGDRSRNMGILMHGDGSFSGQGVVYETLDMSALPGYATGGTIHVVVNNQVRTVAFLACNGGQKSVG